MNRPPLVIYGTMRRWSAPKFRATLQGYFLPASLIAICGYWRTGLLTSTVTHYYLISVPVIIPTIFLGRIINLHIDRRTFYNYIFTGLLAIGIILLLEVINSRYAHVMLNLIQHPQNAEK